MISRALLLSIFVACVASLTTWYIVDRPGLIRSACEAGLPNPTMPSVASGTQFECMVFGKTQTSFGSVRKIQGTLFYESNDLAAEPGGREIGLYDNVHLLCRDDACEDALAQEFSENEVDIGLEGLYSMQFAGIRVTGNLSEDVYASGHFRNVDSLIFAVEKIEEVFDPSAGIVSRWRTRSEEPALAIEDE